MLTIDEFATLRHEMWLNRMVGSPVSSDELANAHYTNLWRELDRQSIYLFNEIQPKTLLNFTDTIVKTIQYRLFNSIHTHQRLQDEFYDHETAFLSRKPLYEFLRSQDSVFTGAYVRCNSLEGVCEAAETSNLVEIAQKVNNSLISLNYKAAKKHIMQVFSLGGFLADQILMDLTWTGGPFEATYNSKYIPALGPGAKNGLAIVGEEFATIENRLNNTFSNLKMPIANGKPVQFDGQTLEHTLCEYYKYVGSANGSKKTRKYKPTTSGYREALPWSWQLT